LSAVIPPHVLFCLWAMQHEDERFLRHRTQLSELAAVQGWVVASRGMHFPHALYAIVILGLLLVRSSGMPRNNNNSNSSKGGSRLRRDGNDGGAPCSSGDTPRGQPTPRRRSFFGADAAAPSEVPEAMVALGSGAAPNCGAAGDSGGAPGGQASPRRRAFFGASGAAPERCVPLTRLSLRTDRVRKAKATAAAGRSR